MWSEALTPEQEQSSAQSQARGNPTSHKGTEENLEGAMNPKALKAAFPRIDSSLLLLGLGVQEKWDTGEKTEENEQEV